MMCSKEYIDRAEQAVLHTYNRFPVVLEKGQGVRLYDVEGKEYLDFAAGIAVFSLGYNHPEYSKTLKEQIDKLLHTSNLYYNVPMVEAAEKLTKSCRTVQSIFYQQRNGGGGGSHQSCPEICVSEGRKHRP